MSFESDATRMLRLIGEVNLPAADLNTDGRALISLFRPTTPSASGGWGGCKAGHRKHLEEAHCGVLLDRWIPFGDPFFFQTRACALASRCIRSPSLCRRSSLKNSCDGSSKAPGLARFELIGAALTPPNPQTPQTPQTLNSETATQNPNF